MTPLAEARRASCRFGTVVAVEDADLSVYGGEVVGLLGANGAGKTTLIRLLLGLVPASGGEVRLFGAAPSRATRRRIGYVPQGLGLYDDLTPGENLAFTRAVYGAGGGRTVGSLPERPVGRLPLGQQRRAAFHQALDHSPDLLFLDEPTSGVDPLGRARLWETVRDATERGLGALVTTHSMEEAEECDRLVVMAAGRVVAHGSETEILAGARATVVTTPGWPAAFAALRAAGLPAALVGRTLRVPGHPPEEVRRALGPVEAALRDAPATLEERFLQLTSDLPVKDPSEAVSSDDERVGRRS